LTCVAAGKLNRQGGLCKCDRLSHQSNCFSGLQVVLGPACGKCVWRAGNLLLTWYNKQLDESAVVRTLRLLTVKNSDWREITMRYAILCLFFMTSTAALAVDYGQLYESVDKDKAAESVDKQQATEAVVEGDVQKGYESVDKEKAADSVDTEKATEALMK
jgi:hypothetical protein